MYKKLFIIAARRDRVTGRKTSRVVAAVISYAGDLRSPFAGKKFPESTTRNNTYHYHDYYCYY